MVMRMVQKCLHTTSSDFCDFTGLIHFLYLILRRQLLRKGARASSCQSHAEGVFIISALPVSGQETGYHRVSGSDTIFQGSLRCFRRIDASVLRQKNRALACHRNQHVDRAFFLQLLRIRNNFLPLRELHAENVSQFMIVRFD